MNWSRFVLVLALGALVATSCAAPDTHEAWRVNREAPSSQPNPVDDEVCDDARALALGSLAGDPSIVPTLEELARIGALVGATPALPALNRIIEILDEGGDHVDIHDDLVTASESVDAATRGACRVPLFSATYAATGWPSCHGELTIPVAGYTVLGESCGSEPLPDALPCFTDTAPFLPINCNTGETVQLVDGEWEEAGEPREVLRPVRPEPESESDPEPERPTTTTTVQVLVEPLDASECRSLFALFAGPDPVDGSEADLDRLPSATRGLGEEIRQLVDAFVAANAEPPDLSEFEALVRELDLATAARCGLPLVSALDALAGGVDELPCWSATGGAYPAHIVRECD